MRYKKKSTTNIEHEGLLYNIDYNIGALAKSLARMPISKEETMNPVVAKQRHLLWAWNQECADRLADLAENLRWYDPEFDWEFVNKIRQRFES